MTPDKLRYIQNSMAGQSRSIRTICRELENLPASNLHHYLHRAGSLKAPERELLGSDERGGTVPLAGSSGDLALSEPPRTHAVA